MLVKDLIHDFGFLSETENRRFRPRVERMNLDPDISGMLGEHVCICVCVGGVSERVLPLE